LPERVARDIRAVHEPVDETLVEGVADLDDDVVDRGGEPRVPHERLQKGLSLCVSVRIAQRYDCVQPESVEDGGNWIDRNGRFWCLLLSAARRADECYHCESVGDTAECRRSRMHNASTVYLTNA
jgi:hypothetical protein